jgi:putative glutamine amidotransferase
VTTPITIGISVSETKYANYPAWILDGGEAIEIVELSWEKQNLDELNRCDGLLLPGGIDIDPFFYKPKTTAYPNQPQEWNRVRDQFEWDLFNLAQSMMMPVLGVCRGLQLINVALGGTLISDIEAVGKQNHRNMDGIDHLHLVQLEADSLLAGICSIQEGIVNSAHHQSVDRLAEPLRLNCISDDEIIEGIEWREKENRSPLLCVQWHPERIENKESNPLSQNIRAWFFDEAEKFKL